MKSAINFGKAQLRVALKEDIPSLSAIDAQTNLSAWSLAWWTAAVLHDHVWVLQDDKHIFAFIVWQTVLDERELHLIATLPEYRRQGWANHLIQHMIALAQTEKIARIVLEVRQHNIAAQQLYLSNGFTQIAVRKQYYKDGEDALIMEKLC